jgi:hypothetical protein
MQPLGGCRYQHEAVIDIVVDCQNGKWQFGTIGGVVSSHPTPPGYDVVCIATCRLAGATTMRDQCPSDRGGKSKPWIWCIKSQSLLNPRKLLDGTSSQVDALGKQSQRLFPSRSEHIPTIRQITK